MKYANVSVKFPEELDRELEQFLEETGVYTNKSEFIKGSVRRYLIELDNEPAIAALRVEQLLARAEQDSGSDDEYTFDSTIFVSVSTKKRLQTRSKPSAAFHSQDTRPEAARSSALGQSSTPSENECDRKTTRPKIIITLLTDKRSTDDVAMHALRPSARYESDFLR